MTSTIGPAAAMYGSSDSSSHNQQVPAAGQLLLAKGSYEGASHHGPVSAGNACGAGGGTGDPASLALDLHKLEGVLFMLLCSHDDTIRCDAYGVLGLLRTLHQQLCVTAEQWGLQPGGGGASMQPQQPQQQAAPASPRSAATPVGASFSSLNASGAFAGLGESVATASTGPAASGGSGSGSGPGFFFTRHKTTTSRDSGEFLQALGEKC